MYAICLPLPGGTAGLRLPLEVLSVPVFYDSPRRGLSLRQHLAGLQGYTGERVNARNGEGGV